MNFFFESNLIEQKKKHIFRESDGKKVGCFGCCRFIYSDCVVLTIRSIQHLNKDVDIIAVSNKSH